MIKTILALLCIAVGIYGWKKQVIDFSGFLASLLVGLLIIFLLPLEWFVPLLVLFTLGGLTAKYKWRLKKKVGIAERKRGRTYANVLGNGSVAVFCALGYFISKSPIFLYAYLAAVAEACGDSVATEIGQLSKKKPRLITNLRPVKIGTSGAISLKGEVAGFLAILTTIAFPAIYLGEFRSFLIVLIASFIGINIDSLIGASLEGKSKYVNNHVTNFVSTLISAVLTILLLI